MKKVGLFPLAMYLASNVALAVEQGDFIYNGFGTVGVTHLGGEEEFVYGVQGQTNDGWRGDQLSKLAIQGQYGITDTLSFTGQLTAKPQQDSWKVGPGNVYLAWQVDDALTLRGGRIGTPIYMYSETINVGFSYPWLRLPEEVYSLVQITNHDGADLLYNRSFTLGVLSAQLSGGNSIAREQYSLEDMHDIDYRDVFAGSLALSTDSFGTFRIGYAEANLKVTVGDVVDTRLFGIRRVDLAELDGQKGKFSSIGHQYDNGVWLSAAEAVKLQIENNDEAETNAFYIMGGRRVGDYLAHITYGQLDSSEGRQKSMTYGLNYSLSPTITLKGEYKRVDTSQGPSAIGVFQSDAQQTLDHALLGTSFGRPDGDIVSVGVDFIF